MSDHVRRRGEPRDAHVEFETEETLSAIREALRAKGHRIREIGSARALLEERGSPSVDVVLNLQEGIWGRNREAWAPILLELYGVPFVGSDPLTLSLAMDKALAKRVFETEGIPTPPWTLADAPSLSNDRWPSVQRQLTGKLRGPWIVKPRWEGSAKGISEGSLATNMRQLRTQARKVVSAYQQDALIERFIRGREATVPIIGNGCRARALSVVERQVECGTTLGPSVFLKPGLPARRVRFRQAQGFSKKEEALCADLALAAYRALGCRDLGRVDLRISEAGEVFVLEVNPLPNLSPDDTFGLVAELLGISYADLIDQVIQCALRR